jgi:hypothetical protein
MTNRYDASTEGGATGGVYFEEEQHFNRLWLLVALPSLAIPVFLVLLLGFNSRILSPLAIALVVAILPALLLYTMKLVTEVDSKHVHIKFPPFTPFIRSHILLSEIAHWEARTYRPIAEYGGWGIRGGPSGRAYNVRGNRGVQLWLTDGKRLLIGSQRAEELAQAITAAKNRSDR